MRPVPLNAVSSETLRFTTVGWVYRLPSGTWCAEHVAPSPETFPSNISFNRTIPSRTQLQAFYRRPLPDGLSGSEFFRVDGNFTGSTDMILRWAACKWGIDEDVVRAQAWTETKWKQGGPDPAAGGGDRRFAITDCVRGELTGLWGYACPGCCYQSWGILQTKVLYASGTWPQIKDSTAFNADYRYAEQRACMNGEYTTYFASSAQQPNSYEADISSANLDRILWGCLGMHFSGSWYDTRAQHYLAELKGYLIAQPWRHVRSRTSEQ